MRILILSCLLTTALAQDAPARLDLKVLYAGVPAAPRSAEWREFLAPKVAAVTVVATADVTRELASAYDVVVVDCPDPLVRDGDGKVLRIDVPKAPGIGLDFGIPTIFVGGMAMVPDRLGLQLGWL